MVKEEFADIGLPQQQEIDEEGLKKRLENFRNKINFILKELPRLDLKESKNVLGTVDKELEFVLKENQELKFEWQVLINIKTTLEKKLRTEMRAEEMRANQKKEMENLAKQMIGEISK